MKRTDIIVMGNGFDLWCKLDSKFSDFVKSREKEEKIFYDSFNKFLEMEKKIKVGIYRYRSDVFLNIRETVKNLSPNINFWDIYFKLKNSDNSNTMWFDIEKDIYEFVHLPRSKNMTLIDLFQEFKDQKKSLHDRDEASDIFQFKKTSLFVLTSELMKLNQTFPASKDFNESKRLLNSSLENESIDTFGRFLLNELYRFEVSFSNYINRQVESKSYYHQNANDLINYMIHQPGKSRDGISVVKNDFFYLNFNYTLPKMKLINDNGTNVHGFAKDILDGFEYPIIIGIDQGQIDLLKQYEYIFTKTYRKLFLKGSHGSQPLPPKVDVDKIYFFGHSLSRADYSYFVSMFDFYDIENSSINLVFCFNVYCESDRDEISHTQYQRVYNLINEYDKKSLDSNKRNLLHRLLLEKRIMIYEVKESAKE